MRQISSFVQCRNDRIPPGPDTSVIPNFVLDEAVQVHAAQAPAEDGPPDLPAGDFLLFVGELSRDKGLPTLLRAYESLGRERPPLLLVGRRMPDTPPRFPAGAQVHAEWPHDHVMAAFRRCLFAALPSICLDACPTTVLEPMDSGRPVVATTTGGTPGIAAVVGQRRWDLVHCQGIHTPVPLLAMVSARRAGLPYLVTFHTGGHSARSRNAMRTAQWRLAGPLLRNAASLIAVSSFEAAALARDARLGDKRVIVIRNGGALPPPRPGTAAVPGRIVSSGRLERYKGHHRVIEALPHVAREIPEAHLLILGSGPYERDLRGLARQLGVCDRVSIEHVPPADRQGMATALAGASVVAEGWVHGVPRAAPAPAVARELVRAMSSASPPAHAQLPCWESCADQLAQVYLSSRGR